MASKNTRSFLSTVALLLLLAIFAFARQSGNPQVPQGGSATFPSTGTESPANSQQWDVVNSSAQIVATASTPVGWQVALSGSTFTVTAPSNAIAATNYKVRYGLTSSANKTRATPAKPSDSPWGKKVSSPRPIGSGKSALFDVISTGPPAAPTNLTATPVSSVEIDLHWTDNSNNESGFKIERALGNGTFAQVAVVAANTTSYADTGLTASTSYSYRVRATNSVGDSAYTNVATATTLTPNPPAAPTNLTATVQSAYQALLQWQDNSNNEQGFSVETLNSSTGLWQPVGTTAANVASYLVAGLSPNTTYSYRVKAYNADGDSAYSNTISFTTPNAPPAPVTTQGTDFWTAIPASGPTQQIGMPRTITVFVSSGTVATGVVAIPGLSFTQTFSIPATGGSASIVIPNYAQMAASDGVEGNAVHITSDHPVDVNIINYCQFASDSFTAYPNASMGTSFRALGYPGNGTTDMNTMLAVVASQDNTTVTIVPSVTLGSRPAGVAYTVTLNTTQTYQLKNNTVGLDLTGTVITSDKPIAVYGAAQGSTVPYGVNSANPLIETIPPVDRWDTSFLVVPFATRSGDMVKVVAARNGTAVAINGTNVATLGAGQFYLGSVSAASLISANKPILVAQLSEGSDSDGNGNADPFMTIVSPIGQYQPVARFTTTANSFGPNYVNIVVPTSAAGDVTLDGSLVGAGNFSAISGTPYSAARITVTAGAHKVATATTGAPLFVTCYGFGPYDGYAHPATMGLNVNPNWSWSGPTPPINLSATTVSSSKINLAWTNVATDATSIKVERQTGSGGWTLVTSVAATATTYSDTGLTPATTYSYRVRACNDIDGTPSNVASATTLDVPPVAPTSLTATATGQTTISLAWTDNSGNESGFKIERKTGAGGTYAQIAVTAANATSFGDTGLTKNTTYYYRIRATNAIGDSAYSNEANATTKDSPPNAPSSLTATAPAYNQVNLSWVDNSTNEQGFYIERATGSGSFARIATVTANTVTFSDFTVTGATTYSYRVQAYNTGGPSAYSNTVAITTPNPPVPTAPTNLVASPMTTSEIDLSWADTSSVESGFTVQRSADGTTFTTIGTTAANVTTYKDTNCSSNTTYWYRVNAFNIAGNSGWSNVASATTAPDAAIVGPAAEPKVSYAVAADGSTINYYWTPASGATSYKVYRGTVSGGTKTLVATVTPTYANQRIQRYIDHGLTAGTFYYYSVTSVIAGVESMQTDEEGETPTPGTLPLNGSSYDILSWALGQQIEGLDYPSPSMSDVSVLLPDGSVVDGSTGSVTYDPRNATLAPRNGSGSSGDRSERGGGQLTLFSPNQARYVNAQINPTTVSYGSPANPQPADLVYNSSAQTKINYVPSMFGLGFYPNVSGVILEGINMYIGFVSYPGQMPVSWSDRMDGNNNIEIGFGFNHYHDSGTLPMRFTPYCRSTVTSTRNDPRYELDLNSWPMEFAKPITYLRADISQLSGMDQNQTNINGKVVNSKWAVGYANATLSGVHHFLVGFYQNSYLGNHTQLGQLYQDHIWAKLGIGLDQVYQVSAAHGSTWAAEPSSNPEPYFKLGHFRTGSVLTTFVPSFGYSMTDSTATVGFGSWQTHKTASCTWVNSLSVLPTVTIRNN